MQVNSLNFSLTECAQQSCIVEFFLFCTNSFNTYRAYFLKQRARFPLLQHLHIIKQLKPIATKSSNTEKNRTMIMAQLNGLTAQATLPLPLSPRPPLETTTAEVAHLKAIAPLFLPLKVLHVKCAARYRLGYGYPATRLPKYPNYTTTCAPPPFLPLLRPLPKCERTDRERREGERDRESTHTFSECQRQWHFQCWQTPR